MGKSQREKARSKRASYTPYSHRPSPAPASSSPHHVDLLRLAFLEWLIAHRSSTDRHRLWDAFLADWAAVPEHELPVPVSRPFNLHSHVKAMRSGAELHARRKEVREGREKLARAGGLRPHQSLLQYATDSEAGPAEEGRTPAEDSREEEGSSAARAAKEAEEDERAVAEARQCQSVTVDGAVQSKLQLNAGRASALLRTALRTAATHSAKRAVQQQQHLQSTTLAPSPNPWAALTGG